MRSLRCGRMAGEVRESIPGWLRGAVIARDRGRCRYCGAMPVGRRRHLDHVRPVFRGGRTEVSNLVVACSACNSAKSARLDVFPMSLAELVDIDDGRAPERPRLRRTKGTRDLSRAQLRAWAATGQRISADAQRRLVDQYPVGSLTRCDECREEFMVGVTGRLIADLATLVCSSCASHRPGKVAASSRLAPDLSQFDCRDVPGPVGGAVGRP